MMFPMCHIYFADRVLDRLSDFTILGSIYPDIVISDMLTRHTTHYNTEFIFNYFRFKDNNMKDFAIGAITHGVDMRGLDYYSDEQYPGFVKGYCFDRGREIEKQVIDCCRIPEDWGLWKAHNFIEMAFDLYLCRKHQWLIESFLRVLEDDEIINYVSCNLEHAYNIPAGIFHDSFKRFAYFAAYDNLSQYSIMERYAYQLRERHDIEGVDILKGVDVLNHALNIVGDEQDGFFNYTVHNIRGVFKEIEQL